MTVAVVGNAPTDGDRSATVERCDRVVRCNRALGYGSETGRRIDDLWLINCGGQMEEWLDERTIERSPAFAAAHTIVLPIHPDKAGLIVPPLCREEVAAAAAQDFTAEAAARYRGLGKRVEVMAPDFFASAVHDLGHAMTLEAPAPSTGYLACRAAVLSGALVHAVGFGFDGWGGHDFAAERRWFEAMERAGRLVVHHGSAPAGQEVRHGVPA